MPARSLPLDYYDALRSGEGRSCDDLAPRAAPGCRLTLGPGRRSASVVAFGGSMTVGDPLHGVRVPYPVLLAQRLVAHGFAREVLVRNLAEGALHGAVVPALCCDEFLTSEHGTAERLGYNRAGTERERTWHVNASAAVRVHDAPPALLEPVDLVLLEFSVNGVQARRAAEPSLAPCLPRCAARAERRLPAPSQFVDVLLRRLRARYPRALLLYVDHFRLSQWRELHYGCRGARPCRGCPAGVCPDCPAGSIGAPAAGGATPGPGTTSIYGCGHVDRFRTVASFGSAPTCSRELQGWLTTARAGFVSLRRYLASKSGGLHEGAGLGASERREEYARLLHLFSSDKFHLTQAGHAAVSAAAWSAIRGQVAGRAGGRASHSQPAAHARLPGRPLSAAPSGGACEAAPAARWEVQCFFWYRSGAVAGGGLAVEGADLEWHRRRPRRRKGQAAAPPPPPRRYEAWALRPGLVRASATSAGEGNGKFAFELNAPDAEWAKPLTFRFVAPAAGSIVRLGFLLHCCMYGAAAIAIDGVRTALVNGSAAGFPHHVFQAATVGSVDAGEHTLSLTVAAAGPNGTRQFRLAGLFVSAPLDGLTRDSEYLIA